MKPSQNPSGDSTAYTSASHYNHQPSSKHRRLLGRARRATSKSPARTAAHSRVSSRQLNDAEKRRQHGRPSRLLSYSRCDSSSGASVSVSERSEDSSAERAQASHDRKNAPTVEVKKNQGPITVHVTVNPVQVELMPMPVVQTRKTEEIARRQVRRKIDLPAKDEPVASMSGSRISFRTPARKVRKSPVRRLHERNPDFFYYGGLTPSATMKLLPPVWYSGVQMAPLSARGHPNGGMLPPIVFEQAPVKQDMPAGDPHFGNTYMRSSHVL